MNAEVGERRKIAAPISLHQVEGVLDVAEIIDLQLVADASVARDEFGVPPLGVGEQELGVSPHQFAASGKAIGNAQRDGG